MNKKYQKIVHQKVKRVSKKIALLVVLLFALTLANSQNNLGFETWKTIGNYKDPADWQTPNMLSTTGVANVSCTQSKNAHTGTNSVAISAIKVSAFSFFDTISGEIDQRVAYSKRPKSFEFYYRYKTAIPSQAYASVSFFRGNEDTGLIGYSEVDLSSAANWTLSKNTINWNNSQTPDSIMISFFSGEKNVTDTLWVDDVALVLSNTSVSKTIIDDFNVYINGNGFLEIRDNLNINIENIAVINSIGATVIENAKVINMNQFDSGIYFCQIVTNKGNYIKKFIKI